MIISWHADITDRKHAELAVSENISILQAIFDNTPLNMNFKDTTGRYQLINNIYADWYGLTPEDIIGKRASEFAFDAPIAADMSNNEKTVLETGKPNQYEVQIRGKDGSLYDRQVIKFPVKTRDGKINSIGTIAIDITQHKQIERKLLEAKESAETANNAKSEFLSSVSHELRTPLNAILGFSQMLERGHREPLGEFQKKCVDHIVAGGNHFLGLINKSAIDRRLTISDDLTATQTVNADYTRFKQVLLNLLSNAVKYNREGGTVTLTTKDVSDNAIRILVVDTGAGIADEDQIGLFEPFNRLGQEAGEIEGTGIGLTITKQLVEAMGGEIGYDTEVGKGSTFWIKFPAIERTLANRMEPVEVSKTDADQNQSNMAAEILYIEDNPANLQLMEAVIEEMDGLTLISAHNAELGMTMASEQQPNLILMDINLPGIDGVAAMHALSANDATKDIPVIAISAAAMKSDVERSMSAGFKDYLTKPFNVPELVKSIKKELDG
ncbi:MAG: response regulator [Rhodospirillaceae bacterium]|nr:response regulator [Rhodospirillaceae bacterium]MBT7248606.1 response regulator [Rhodospirillaceae bacterium]